MGGESGGDSAGQGGEVTAGFGGTGTGGTSSQGGAGGESPSIGGGGGSELVTFTFGERSSATQTGVTRDTKLVAGASASNNFGAAEYFQADGDPVTHPILRFEVSAVPPTATVVAAKLRLWVSECTDCASAADNPVRVYRVLEAWSEGNWNDTPGSANWTKRTSDAEWTAAGCDVPSRASDLVVEFSPTISNQEYEVELPVPLVQDWISDPASNHGLVMNTALGAASTDGVEFLSSESSAIEKRPLLEVTFSE